MLRIPHASRIPDADDPDRAPARPATGAAASAHARAVVEAALAHPPDEIVAALLRYYAPDSDECGSAFLDGAETSAPGTVTGADLFAVTTLGLPVPPSAARRLLHDTPEAEAIASCLSCLPVDTTLPGADGATVHAMSALHHAVVAALAPRPDERTHAVATALCARKRPELFPVLDAGMRAALALPSAAQPGRSWTILRHVLRDGHVDEALADRFERARRVAPQLRLDVYPLRRLHVLVRDVGFAPSIDS